LCQSYKIFKLKCQGREMFSGIVHETGSIKNICRKKILTLECLIREVKNCSAGDSVSVNGVCLTITDIQKESSIVKFQVVKETLNITNLIHLYKMCEVNIELSSRYGDRIGGHLVQGHVDFIGEIIFIKKDLATWTVDIKVNQEIAKNIINKGFITIDGMSITIVKVSIFFFTVAFIPYTINNSIVKNYTLGTKVNIEVDTMGKYINKYIEKTINVLKNKKKS